MVEVGTEAPDFELQDARGNSVRLADLRGKKVVLYFYPKADTPGCTAESCAFRDARDNFESADAVIVGISPDKVSDQAKFADKFGLPFRLLCDPEHTVAEQYGVWVEKKNYGKTYMGIQRSTFIIDRAGKIARVFPRVSVEGHADETLKAVQQLD